VAVDEHHEHAHDHGHDHDHEHDHVELEGGVEVPDGAVAACESMQEHGRHSLAHRGIAATPAPWGLAPVASAPWISIERACTPVATPRSREPQAARARGPPALT
jgi:hypothetical protein